MSGFLAVVLRDLRVLVRRRSEVANPILFYIIITMMFPLGLAADGEMIRQAAPAILWVGALLAILMALDMVLKPDFDSGALEQMAMSPIPLALTIFAKSVALWIAVGVPLIVVAPLIGISLGLGMPAAGMLALTLALGSPTLILVGTIGVGLTAGLRQAGVIMSLIVTPLYTPVLIFGARAVDDAMDSLPYGGALWLLAAGLALAITVAPIAAAGAVRTMLE